MKKSSCMNKDSSNLSKSRFGYFRRSLVNFKNLKIISWNIFAIQNCSIQSLYEQAINSHIKTKSIMVAH